MSDKRTVAAAFLNRHDMGVPQGCANSTHASPAMPFSTDPGQAPIVKCLEQLAKLRAGDGGVSALSEGVFSENAFVAQYCLKRMMTRSPIELERYIPRLRQLQNNPDRIAAVCLLANQLANKLPGMPAYSEDEYSWLKQALISGKTREWQQLRLFADRLAEFHQKRSDTISLLGTVVKDPNAPKAVRIAAYSILPDRRLMNYAKPDVESQRVFDICVGMLKDPDPMLRMAGTHLLHSINSEIGNRSNDPSVISVYKTRARQALGQSIRSEPDGVTRTRMQYFLGLIDSK